MNKDDQANILNAQLAAFFGQMTKYFDERFDKLEAKVDSKADADRTYKLLDGIAARLETETIERTALSSQIDRHEGWIKQLAAKNNLRLKHD
jgi:hypothetical protein